MDIDVGTGSTTGTTAGAGPSTRAVATGYFSALQDRDWRVLDALLADDVRYELPQTCERITGHEALLRFNQEYPGDWRLRVSRLVCAGGDAAAWIVVEIDGTELDACVWLRVDGGRVTEITDFWPEPYEPPPGREHLTTRYQPHPHPTGR
jgi:ketosteroid isomerase-like protein